MESFKERHAQVQKEQATNKRVWTALNKILTEGQQRFFRLGIDNPNDLLTQMTDVQALHDENGHYVQITFPDMDELYLTEPVMETIRLQAETQEEAENMMVSITGMGLRLARAEKESRTFLPAALRVAFE